MRRSFHLWGNEQPRFIGEWDANVTRYHPDRHLRDAKIADGLPFGTPIQGMICDGLKRVIKLSKDIHELAFSQETAHEVCFQRGMEGLLQARGIWHEIDSAEQEAAER